MPPATRKKVRLTVDDGPNIKFSPIAIRVGEEVTTFFVHEALLCTNSMFFTRALKKEWAEGETRQVNLPDTLPDTFEIWVKWLYTGRLCFSPTDRDGGEGDRKHWFIRECEKWRDIYALADFLQDSDLKDAAIDAHVESILEADTYAPPFATWVYPHSTTASAHRKLAVDLFIETWDHGIYLERSFYPSDFSYDLVINIGPCLPEGQEKKSIKEFFRGADRCKYHDHGSEKPCYRTKPTFTL